MKRLLKVPRDGGKIFSSHKGKARTNLNTANIYKLYISLCSLTTLVQFYGARSCFLKCQIVFATAHAALGAEFQRLGMSW